MRSRSDGRWGVPASLLTIERLPPRRTPDAVPVNSAPAGVASFPIGRLDVSIRQKSSSSSPFRPRAMPAATIGPANVTSPHRAKSASCIAVRSL
jgi:hypothetical protein